MPPERDLPFKKRKRSLAPLERLPMELHNEVLRRLSPEDRLRYRNLSKRIRDSMTERDMNRLDRVLYFNVAMTNVEAAMFYERQREAAFLQASYAQQALETNLGKTINCGRFLIVLWRLELLFSNPEFDSDESSARVFAYRLLSTMTGWAPWLKFLQIDENEIYKIGYINDILDISYSFLIEGIVLTLGNHAIFILDDDMLGPAREMVECLQKHTDITHHIGLPPNSKDNCAICRQKITDETAKFHEGFFMCTICRNKFIEE